MTAKLQISHLVLFSMMLFSPLSSAHAEALDSRLKTVESHWASVSVEPNERLQIKSIRALLDDVRKIHTRYPESAKVAAWHGIVARAYTDAKRSPRIAREARDAFLKAESLDPLVFGGLVYANLGALYTEASSKFGGFGNKTRGLGYFWKAIVVDPDGIESNYLYAKMLADEKNYQAARDTLKRAKTSSPQPLGPKAGLVRQNHIAALLEDIESRL